MILPTQLVHIRISKELLHQVDTAADSLYLSRNEYIRQAVAEKLRTTTLNAFPSLDGVNILMTNKQLTDLIMALKTEKRRRGIAYYGYTRKT